jgi:hypothetical protein
MTAQIGPGGHEPLGDARPDLVREITGIEPERDDWIEIQPLGFRSTRRLHVSDIGGRVLMVTWPTELQGQARYLYGRLLAVPLVSAALDRGWMVKPTPHLAYHTAPSSRRLYMYPGVEPVLYAGQWEEPDALRRVGNHTRQEVEEDLWPWLKARGYADDGDDEELRQLLDQWLLRRPAHMRPGMQFRREWSREEVSSLGATLATTMRDEFNSVFAVAEEPALGDARPVQRSSGPTRDVRPAGAREAIPEGVRHEVWRRDQGKCVDCGSRERLEFDHIIQISRGGSNTARNIELRCEVCNRKKAASV